MGVTRSSNSGSRSGISYLVSYTRSKLMDDASSVFDASILTGPVANFPVADSFNRNLERDYSTGDIPHVFVASAVWDIPVGSGPARAVRAGSLGALVERLDGDRRRDAAVGRADRGYADDQLQRLRRIRHAAAEPGRRSRASSDQRSVSRWFNTGAFARRRSSRSARARATRFAAGLPERRPRVDPAGRRSAPSKASSSGRRSSI